ncbi:MULTISPECIES: preprotein translocase subunit SecA [Peptoniphilus]|jgi:preprotein translocase, secA subunit|uniref:preprotein translocase subunit SecA n=2 Tax=Peptoniphilaceae TaxID=1570339 RepID=UPI00028966DB|nr:MULTISPECIES: preprotein translocase subunit SecA [Peptoniphilus]MBS6610529.1 preprotein translocase subunit SecA [Peptoniphilus harei]MDU2116153.1 preprotein translocase subunit SecA [Peptoniphilus lacydonensis]MDU3750857.1 preprotein translocase subunit SecA [Peptoniphilus rhinitidis]MDU5377219.1 preprotein translocase subunit SecA [Peptoniphilus lacydonensis]MDU5437569.1 preprotein translocase subunit SecA [Peptoniphilus lacydonensis]
MGLMEKIFGTYSDRELKKIEPLVNKVMDLEGEMEKLSDNELKAKTEEFKNRLNNGETTDDILPEAFAVVREAAWRVLGMKHFRVQVIGGIVLHQGRIAEMKTGEGKTLVATLPAYLNALEGKGTHIVTVNDYLASRDRDWMGKVYEFLGLSVGCIIHDMDQEDRKIAYNCDITYGTNNEFGFDYLRDNMVIYKEEMVQRGLHFCIVDEVDSILIDEARTPLIISGQGDESVDLYVRARDFVNTLSHRIKSQDEIDLERFNREFEEETVDYVINEKDKTATLTDKGIEKAEKYFGIENLSDASNMELSHHINQALKAAGTMKNDIDYVVKDGEIIIVDEFTGRLMYGRRYSEGLHQAIEAKEGLEVRAESKTLATITFQNYFRMYKKLSGMTGTAMTEEGEFRDIYNIDVVEIPTNKPVIRDDDNDQIYINEDAKFKAVTREIEEAHAKGQPVLVGTISIDKSEALSKYLKRAGIKHNVLNAKKHEQESEIVAQAGRFGQVTIATNMAGRGTDIVLGGNPEYLAKKELKKQGMEEEMLEYADSYFNTDDSEILKAREDYQNLVKKFKEETDKEAEEVKKAGGLRIIGTERHESRRIDNQLRGRSGRQGDPGFSRFYISADDDLIRLFAGDRFKETMLKLDPEEDEPIEHKILTRLIESAQRKVEGNNFSIRKNVLKYDDVMNKQREVIYAERRKVLEGENLKDDIMEMRNDVIDNTIDFYNKLDDNNKNYLDFESIRNFGVSTFDFEEDFLKGIENPTAESLKSFIKELADEKYKEKEEDFGEEKFREIERVALLQNVDQKWMDHIDAMDQLRKGIGLRAVGQTDPVRAYAEEGFDMFQTMNESIKEDTVKMLYHVANPEKVKRVRVAKEVETVNPDDGKKKPYVRKEKKVGRNDPCPCGSGKKYKNCHGKYE